MLGRLQKLPDRLIRIFLCVAVNNYSSTFCSGCINKSGGKSLSMKFRAEKEARYTSTYKYEMLCMYA